MVLSGGEGGITFLEVYAPSHFEKMEDLGPKEIKTHHLVAQRVTSFEIGTLTMNYWDFCLLKLLT